MDIRRELDLTAFALEDAATVIEQDNPALAAVMMKRVAAARQALNESLAPSEPVSSTAGDSVGSATDGSRERKPSKIDSF